MTSLRPGSNSSIRGIWKRRRGGDQAYTPGESRCATGLFGAVKCHNRYYRRNALWRSGIHVCILTQLPELPAGRASRTRSVQCRRGSVTAVITSVYGVRQGRVSHGMGRRPPAVHPSGTNGAGQRSSEISGVLYWGARHVPRRPHYICRGSAALFRHCDELRMPTAATGCAP